MNIHEWAARWRLTPEALAELKRDVFNHDGVGSAGPVASHAGGETAVAATIRLEAAQKGLRLWRNNVGACYDDAGRFIRYGLANDSAQLNKHIKSADLIGIRPLTITPAHVGHTVGQFVSREVKAPGWNFTETDREKAQQRWLELVLGLGGDAGFATGVGTL